MPKKRVRQSVIVENSSAADLRPRQPQRKKSPPPGAAPLRRPAKKKSTRGLLRDAAEAKLAREHISKETIEAAHATGLLPHEWLLAVMRGEQLNHFAYDSETQEIVEIIVLPTFSDRMEAAKAAAPFYAARMAKPGPAAGNPEDPAKSRGLLAIPLVDSVQQWIDKAGASQARLKKEVTK